MKRFQSILCASLLTLSISSIALAGDLDGRYRAGDLDGRSQAGDLDGRTKPGDLDGRPGDLDGIYSTITGLLGIIL